MTPSPRVWARVARRPLLTLTDVPLRGRRGATGFRHVQEEHERPAAQVPSDAADVHRGCRVDDARRSPALDVGLPHLWLGLGLGIGLGLGLGLGVGLGLPQPSHARTHQREGARLVSRPPWRGDGGAGESAGSKGSSRGCLRSSGDAHAPRRLPRAWPVAHGPWPKAYCRGLLPWPVGPWPVACGPSAAGRGVGGWWRRGGGLVGSRAPHTHSPNSDL